MKGLASSEGERTLCKTVFFGSEARSFSCVIKHYISTMYNYDSQHILVSACHLTGVDSDFKAVDFDRRLRSNSKSNGKSELTIGFRYKIDLFWSKFNISRSLSIYFWLKDRKRPSKCKLSIIQSKTTTF